MSKEGAVWFMKVDVLSGACLVGGKSGGSFRSGRILGPMVV